MFQAPTHLTNARRLFDYFLLLSIVLHILTRFWTPTDVFMLYMCAPFSPFSSHKFLNLFIFSHLFSPSFGSFPFLIAIFLYSHLYAHFFHRTQLYSSARFIRSDYLLVCFSFHSSQSSRNVRLLTTRIPPYSPIVVVIMLILSILEWFLSSLSHLQ